MERLLQLQLVLVRGHVCCERVFFKKAGELSNELVLLLLHEMSESLVLDDKVAIDELRSLRTSCRPAAPPDE